MRRGWAARLGGLLFLALTLANLRLSRPYLTDRHAHGYYRFFAFEAIAGLVGLNLQYWFRRPLSPRQLVSWPLLFAAAGLAGYGFYQLRHEGEPRAGQTGTEGLIPGFEDTSTLVRSGAYRFLRHPLYASLLYLAWGVFLKEPSPRALLLVSLASASLFQTARAEEEENRRRFGPAYDEYVRHTRMFVPGLL